MPEPPTVRMCSGCGKHPLTPEWNSDAHIFPNALGGRLAPSGLICRECNTLLNELADNPLIRAFGPWPTLLDIPRQNGKHPPVVVETSGGQRVRVEPDGSRSLAEVVYDVAPIPGGHQVDLGANNWKVVKQLINRAAKQFPQLDPAQAKAHARVIKIPPTDQWRVTTNFAPENVFPAAFAAFWLFFLWKTGRPLLPWQRALEVLKGVRTDCTFRYLPDGLPGLTGPAIPIAHKIVIRTVPATGQLIGYFEVLGTLRVGGLIAEGRPNNPLEHIYVADVFGKTDRSAEYSIDAKKFDVTNWKTVGLDLGDRNAVATYITTAQQPLKVLWQKREAELTARERARRPCFLSRFLAAIGLKKTPPH
jgi:hypothetical protein